MQVPALRSAVASTTFETSPAELRRFTKAKATARIDMAVALAMAVGAATAKEPAEMPDSYTLAHGVMLL